MGPIGRGGRRGRTGRRRCGGLTTVGNRPAGAAVGFGDKRVGGAHEPCTFAAEHGQWRGACPVRAVRIGTVPHGDVEQVIGVGRVARRACGSGEVVHEGIAFVVGRIARVRLQ